MVEECSVKEQREDGGKVGENHKEWGCMPSVSTPRTEDPMGRSSSWNLQRTVAIRELPQQEMQTS